MTTPRKSRPLAEPLFDRPVLIWEAKGLKPKYSVAGINHPKGACILFKSLQRAENHCKNVLRLA